ncbi:MAG: hypothetical protein HKN33_05145 [Pyrinomonadaceae bacterium]|nr:hypothetical protein [Pyrinomonadaceae bacterium]
MKLLLNKILVATAFTLCLAIGAMAQSGPKKPPPKPKPPVIKPKPKPKPKPESTGMNYDVGLAVNPAKY